MQARRPPLPPLSPGTAAAAAPGRAGRDAATLAEAAAKLFDRPASATWSAEAAAAFAERRDAGRHKDRSAIRFRIGPEWFAVATGAFDEVVSRRIIHTLPHKRAPALLGLVNVRGELVVCLSLARLLAIEGDAEPSRWARLMVLRGPSGRCAVPVDEVQHTCRFHDGEVVPPPDTVARAATAFTRGLLPDGGRMLSWLDEGRLLAELDRCLA